MSDKKMEVISKLIDLMQCTYKITSKRDRYPAKYKILVDLGIYPSISEIRRNNPELMINLGKIDFIDGLKVKKKRWIWILVGE